MQQNKLTFKKDERLTGEIRIGELFSSGEFMLSYPFRMGYVKVPKTTIPVRVLISVPKKRFKHAVDRNRIKRQIREAYRLNKQTLYNILNEKDYSLHLSITYISSDKLPSEFIHRKWIEAIGKLAVHMSTKTDSK